MMDSKEFVKKNLWNRSIKVKDMSAIDPELPYDLYVEETYKLKVITYGGTTGLLDLSPTDFDILAVVYHGEVITRAFYIKSGKDLEAIRMQVLTTDLLKEHFTKKIKTLI